MEARRSAVTNETNHVAVEASWIKGERFIMVCLYDKFNIRTFNTLNLGVSKLNNCAGELARFSFPLVWLWSGGATSGWWAYLLSETCDGAGTVRTRRHWQALLSGSPTRAPAPAGVAWSVAWRAQVKPGGEECDSANKVAPRRRKRPGFSPPPLPPSHSPSRRGRLSERHSPHCVVAPQCDQ